MENLKKKTSQLGKIKKKHVIPNNGGLMDKIPSGNLLHSELENHLFEWEKPL